ncbi:flagellin N-terminal helical domain-containing protein [Sphingosinicella sp.]|uniref:flagellin N-terminal helical domain-containing protein n=1 Tax=Sphingosinicella sp. TaxID=1917971 RepID=UPI0040376C2C
MIGTNYRLTMETNRQAALAREIARGQTEISTTRRIQSPSDDPVAAARVSEIARTQANEASWKSNLDLANALAAGAETTLETTANAVTRAHELMVAGANGTLSGTNRAAMALELRSIAAEITTLKDARDARGNRLFMPGWALQIPVAAGLAVTAAGTREEVFEQVPTAGGPRDLADIIADAATALEGGNSATISASVTEVLAGVEHIAGIRGQQGARGNRIDQLVERFETTKIQLTEERSVLEDTDVNAAIAKLQSQQLTLQAAQAVFARVNQSTLFDILR